MQNFLLRTFLFFAIVVALNNALELLMPDGWENVQHHFKRKDFLERHTDANTVFFGSSRTYAHINPVQFDSLNALKGIETNSYMMASSSVFFNELRFLLKSFRKEVMPKVGLKYMFIELDNETFIDTASLYLPQASHYVTPGNLGFCLKTLYADRSAVTQLIEQTSYYLISCLVQITKGGYGDDRIKFQKPKSSTYWHKYKGHMSLTMEDPFFRRGDYLRRRNLLLEDTTIIERQYQRAIKMDSIARATKEHNPVILQSYLDLISEMKSNGIHVVFVLPARSLIRSPLKGLYYALPQENRVDMNAVAATIPELHTLDYWFDQGHLNKEGVSVYTAAFAKEVAKLQIMSGNER